MGIDEGFEDFFVFSDDADEQEFLNTLVQVGACSSDIEVCCSILKAISTGNTAGIDPENIIGDIEKTLLLRVALTKVALTAVKEKLQNEH